MSAGLFEEIISSHSVRSDTKKNDVAVASDGLNSAAYVTSIDVGCTSNDISSSSSSIDRGVSDSDDEVVLYVRPDCLREDNADCMASNAHRSASLVPEVSSALQRTSQNLKETKDDFPGSNPINPTSDLFIQAFIAASASIASYSPTQILRKAAMTGAGAVRACTACAATLQHPLEYMALPGGEPITIRESPHLNALVTATVHPGRTVHGYPGGLWLRLAHQAGWVLLAEVADDGELTDRLQGSWAVPKTHVAGPDALDLEWPGVPHPQVSYYLVWRPSQMARLCPEGHTLQQFVTSEAGYSCSMCKSIFLFPKRLTMAGCRDCNYHLCQECGKENCIPKMAPQCTFSSTAQSGQGFARLTHLSHFSYLQIRVGARMSGAEKGSPHVSILGAWSNPVAVVQQADFQKVPTASKVDQRKSMLTGATLERKSKNENARADNLSDELQVSDGIAVDRFVAPVTCAEVFALATPRGTCHSTSSSFTHIADHELEELRVRSLHDALETHHRFVSSSIDIAHPHPVVEELRAGSRSTPRSLSSSFTQTAHHVSEELEVSSLRVTDEGSSSSSTWCSGCGKFSLKGRFGDAGSDYASRWYCDYCWRGWFFRQARRSSQQ